MEPETGMLAPYGSSFCSSSLTPYRFILAGILLFLGDQFLEIALVTRRA